MEQGASPYLLLQVPNVAQVEPGSFGQCKDEEGSEQEELVVAGQQVVLQQGTAWSLPAPCWSPALLPLPSQCSLPSLLES